MKKIQQYDNYISLGCFCGVAQDLEKLGLRNTSSPFDWCITDFDGVIKLIDNRFDGFMEYENLAQNNKIRSHYMDTKFGVAFFHDFSQYKPLNTQYESVRAKYLRRTDRFLTNIERPTLFIRYISSKIKDDNGKYSELKWIEENNDYINEVLKRYNPKNDIIYIGNENAHSDIIKIYNVKADDNDTVARNPIVDNKELYPIMKQVEIPGQQENIQRLEKKQNKKQSFNAKIKNKLQKIFCKKFCKVYIHTKEYK